MNEVSKFYKELLEMLGLVIDESGLINIAAHNIKKPLEIDGVPLYLPTDDAVATSVEVVNNRPKSVKVMFNPLEEDVYKGVNDSFNKLKAIMELKVLHVVSQLGISLLTIMANNSGELVDMELIKFVNVLNKNKIGKRKSMVDEKTVKTWISLYEKVLSSLDKKYVRFINKKSGEIDGIKYNRIGTVTFPFIEKLEEATTSKEKFMDIKLRTVDTMVLKALFEYMFVSLEPSGVNQFGSLNKKSPSLHVLLLEYDSVYKRLAPIIETVLEHGVEDDIAKSLDLKPMHVKMEALSDYIDSLDSDVRRIPKESSMVQKPVKKPSVLQQVPTKKQTGSFWDRIKNSEPQTTKPLPVVRNQPVRTPYRDTGLRPVNSRPMSRREELDPWASNDRPRRGGYGW